MELSLTNLVVAVVFGSMGLVVFFAFISSGYRRRGRAKSCASTVVCRICLHAYQVEDADRVSECPKCGARNERGYHLGPR